MYDSGFNPRAMADFFEKLQAEGGGARPAVFSDHRIREIGPAVAREVATLPRKDQLSQRQAPNSAM